MGLCAVAVMSVRLWHQRAIQIAPEAFIEQIKIPVACRRATLACQKEVCQPYQW